MGAQRPEILVPTKIVIIFKALLKIIISNSVVLQTLMKSAEGVTTIDPLPELILNHREDEGTTPLKIWPYTNNS